MIQNDNTPRPMGDGPLQDQAFQQPKAAETPSNSSQLPAAAKTEPAPVAEIDRPSDWNELPTRTQFDTTGAVRDIPAPLEVHKPTPELKPESLVKDDKGLRLTDEQRDHLKKHAPHLYKLLQETESGKKAALNGKAGFESHPFRPATDLFGENPTTWVYSDLSHAAIREMAAAFLSLDMTDPRNQELTNEISAAISQNPNEDFGIAALTREGSNWVQSVKAPGNHKLHGRVYSYEAAKPQKLRGAQAIAYAAAISGAGRPSAQPLWSSGWHAMFKAASGTDWTLYHEEMVEKRSELGRSTLGVGFSSSRALFVEQSLNFALNNLESTSFKMPPGLTDRTEVLKYLRCSDIDSFLTGFLVACHPDGYPIRMPCSNIGKCSHVTELDANLRTMVVTDEKVPTEEHLYHMVKSSPAASEFESMLSYQASLKTNQTRLVKLRTSHLTGQDIFVEFHNPSAYDYIQSSKRWIERVKSMMATMLKDTTSVTRRIELQNKFYWTAAMRDYGHLVKSIHIGEAVIEEDPENKDNPRMDIENYLTTVSENDALREAFRKEAIDYMNSTIMSLVVVPSYECPVCNHNNVTPETTAEGYRFYDCIPVDVPMVFFNLALRRLIQLGSL